MNSPTQVLVAEDNAALQSVIRFNLEQAGFEVTVASDGEAAWTAAQQCKFALVITDQQMPRVTGVELCRRLREHPEYSRTPVIMLTAKGLELQLGELQRELGLAVVLAKPFSPRELVQTATECLSGTQPVSHTLS